MQKPHAISFRAVPRTITAPNLSLVGGTFVHGCLCIDRNSLTLPGCHPIPTSSIRSAFVWADYGPARMWGLAFAGSLLLFLREVAEWNWGVSAWSFLVLAVCLACRLRGPRYDVALMTTRHVLIQVFGSSRLAQADRVCAAINHFATLEDPPPAPVDSIRDLADRESYGPDLVDALQQIEDRVNELSHHIQSRCHRLPE